MSIINYAKQLINGDRSKEFFNSLKPHYTPDIAYLDRYATQWIFIYDPTFLSNVPSEDKEVKAVGYTDDPIFMLWKKKLGEFSYPIPMGFAESVPQHSYLRTMKIREDGKTRPIFPSGRIRGQLIRLRNPGPNFFDLDRQAMNTVEFERKRTKIMIPYYAYPYNTTVDVTVSGANHTGWKPMVTYVRAWMYVGKPEYWQKQIEQDLLGPTKAYLSRKQEIGGYYFFSPLELEASGDASSPLQPITHSTLAERRKRLAAMNIERNKWNVKDNSIQITLPKVSFK